MEEERKDWFSQLLNAQIDRSSVCGLSPPLWGLHLDQDCHRSGILQTFDLPAVQESLSHGFVVVPGI